jgi:hypothetical protein
MSSLKAKHVQNLEKKKSAERRKRFCEMGKQQEKRERIGQRKVWDDWA